MAVHIALVAVGSSRAVEVDNSVDNSVGNSVDTVLDSQHSSALRELPSQPENTEYFYFFKCPNSVFDRVNTLCVMG